MRPGIWIAWSVLVLAPGCQPESTVCLSNISLDLTNTAAHGYNAAVRGMVGSVNALWACPGGGSAQISGTVMVTGSTTDFNLTFDFTACADATTSSELVLTGRMTARTVFNSSSGDVTSMVAHADALMIRGDEIGCIADPIDATCIVDITVASGISEGTICGLEF